MSNDSRIVYVNGQYLPANEASISIFDRGFLFADGVYEVTSILEGGMVDNGLHIQRLQRSLSELDMDLPVSIEELVEIQENLIQRNALEEGMLYLQVTRGAADRDFAYPKEAKPSLVLFTQSKNIRNSPAAEKGLNILSVEDIRWKRRDIKTVGLLAPSMAKQAALNAGADDAWMVENGFVNEGSSNNAFIIINNTIVTRHLGNEILHGITRKVVLQLAKELELVVEERPFTLEEAYRAEEAFVTSATTFATSVVSVDGHRIGDGKPGPIVQSLRKLYIDTALENVRAQKN